MIIHRVQQGAFIKNRLIIKKITWLKKECNFFLLQEFI
jgi:hypothetical protein